jgi:hypothetical protein
MRAELAGEKRKVWIDHDGQRFFRAQFLNKYLVVSLSLYNKRIKAGMTPYAAATTPSSRSKAA